MINNKNVRMNDHLKIIHEDEVYRQKNNQRNILNRQI